MTSIFRVDNYASLLLHAGFFDPAEGCDTSPCNVSSQMDYTKIVFLHNAIQLLVTANDVPSSLFTPS
jgi:hypothetical protein